ncbi:MAG: amidohydrolase family protein [Clostridia bacterium]|nr:amidohydrolase family protein [Clostridia bacterium]
MIIDFHTHAFPEKIAARAIDTLAGRSGFVPQTDGTVDSLLARLDEWRVDRAVVANIATNPRQQANVNAFAVETMRQHGDRLTPLGSVNPDAADWDQTLVMLRDAGIPGIKLHPDYMGHTFDEAVYTPILETAASLDLFVLIHAGFDVYSPDKIHATPAMIRQVLVRHPSLKLICAHYGGNCLWNDVEELLVGENVWIDTSIGHRMGLSADQAKRILENHDSQRILFGTDCPWADVPATVQFIESLGLDSERLDRIFYKNAKELLKL